MSYFTLVFTVRTASMFRGESGWSRSSLETFQTALWVWSSEGALTPAVWATWPAQRKTENCCGRRRGGWIETFNHFCTIFTQFAYFTVSSVLFFTAFVSRFRSFCFLWFLISPLSRKNVFSSRGEELQMWVNAQQEKTQPLWIPFLVLSFETLWLSCA